MLAREAIEQQAREAMARELEAVREQLRQQNGAHERRMEQLRSEFAAEKEGVEQSLAVQQQLLAEKARLKEKEAKDLKQELDLLSAGMEQKERARKEQMRAIVKDVAEGYTKEKQEAIEKVRAEAARQQREDRERQKQMEAAYEDKVATLEKEKEQESTEYHQEQLETFQRYRPVEDVTTLVGELLLRDKTSELKDTTGCFVEQIKRRHQTKNLGALNVQYMLDELGLPQEAQMEAFYWFEAVRDNSRDPPEGMPRFESVFLHSMKHNGKLVVNETSELVVSLRQRSQQARTRKKWTTKVVDDVLEYLRFICEEYENSKPPALGFEVVVWNTCASYECHTLGKCTVGTLFKRGAWTLHRSKGEMNPVNRLKLLHTLQAKEREAAAKAAQRALDGGFSPVAAEAAGEAAGEAFIAGSSPEEAANAGEAAGKETQAALDDGEAAV